MNLNIVNKIDDFVKIKKVLISVADKSGIVEFCQGLFKLVPDVKLYSTGGTFALLREKLPAYQEQIIAVSEYTGQPEMQGGLVKTLDFKIYLGLLSETYNQAHQKDLERLSASVFDMVVVNLYPFEKVTAETGVTLEKARTNIDIGGPCMLRASAKNFLRVASVCDPEDYALLLEELEKNQGSLDIKRRLYLARKSFTRTAAYDRAISHFLENADADTLAAIYQY